MNLEDDSLEFLEAQLGSVNEMLARMSDESITSRRSMESFKERLEEAIKDKKK